MKRTYTLLPPTMPNFIATDIPKASIGIGEPVRIAVEELTHDEALEYGELMKKAFIEHHAKRRANAMNPQNPIIR